MQHDRRTRLVRKAGGAGRLPARSAAFTLVDLVIAMAILGILISLAVPVYQDLTLRAKTVECLSLASETRLRVADFYANHGVAPGPDSGLLEYWTPTEKCPILRIQDEGVIAMQAASSGWAPGPELRLRPYLTGPGIGIGWHCELVSGQSSHVPAACRNPPPELGGIPPGQPLPTCIAGPGGDC